MNVVRSLFLKIFLWFWAANLALAAIAIAAALVFKSPDNDTTLWRSVAGNALAAQSRAALQVYEKSGGSELFRYLNDQDAAAGIHTFLVDPAGRDLGGHRVPDKLLELTEIARQSGSLEIREEDDKSLVALAIKSTGGEMLVFAREMLTSGQRFRGPPPPSVDGPSGLGGRPQRGGHHLVEVETRSGEPGDSDPPLIFSPPRGPVESHARPRGRRPPPLPGLFLQRLLDAPGTIAAILVSLGLAGGAICYGLARYLTQPIQSIRSAAKSLANGNLTVRVGAAAGGRRDEIADLARDFDHMAERLQTLLSAHQRLVRDVSHELRSPLARLSVALELVLRKVGETAREPMQRAQAEIIRLNEMIGQLLALSRLESSADAPAMGRIDFRELVAQAVADADFEATASNRCVRATLPESCHVVGSAELLRSAIENVLRNAVAYTPRETTVDVALEVVPRDDGSAAMLSIRDHGPGVPTEHLEDIFQPFFRVSEARDAETGGNGIGLAIADRAVQLHRGTIEAGNHAAGGLLVRISIPCS